MALKDRLEALKHPAATQVTEGEPGLSVIPGLRKEVEPASHIAAASSASPRTGDARDQKGSRNQAPLASAKAESDFASESGPL